MYLEGPNAGRPAVVERGQRLASDPVVEQIAAVNAARDQAVMGVHGGVGGMVRALTTTGTGSSIVPVTLDAQIIDRARDLAAVLQAGAEPGSDGRPDGDRRADRRPDRELAR